MNEAGRTARTHLYFSWSLSALVAICAISLILLGLYTATIGTIPIDLHRSYALLLCAVIVVAGSASAVGDPTNARSGISLVVDVLFLSVFAYAIVRFATVLRLVEYEFYIPTTFDVIVAFLGIGLLLEFGRRVWGLPLTVVATCFLAYLVFGHLLPNAIGHRQISWPDLSTGVWYGYQGVFGSTLSAVLNIVIVFVLFGTLLESTGAGATLLKIAFAVTGRTRAGPAHAAIVASSLFGTMSGSTVANVVGTGTFTIPMMKKRGFSPEMAGGIEATASSGGQIVPPIMGAAAFIMADVLGVPYLTVAIAALVPAALYYLNLYFSVTLEARKIGIEPIPAHERQKITRMDLVRSLQFLIPIGVVTAVMISGRSVAFSGVCAIVSVVVAGFIFNPELRNEPLRLVSATVAAGRNAAGVVLAVGMIGIVIGTLDVTGAGLKFASYIGYLGSGNLFLSLVLGMSGALLLGMGMPTLPAYLIIALVLGPALEMMGIPILAAHMFVFYYGVASSITPPVALAAYAAAPIAGSDPLRTGLMAVRLGMAKFLVPFMFVYNPVLLFIGDFDLAAFVMVLGRSILAFWLLSSALTRYDRLRLNAAETVLRVAAAGLLIVNWEAAQLCGLLLGAALLAHHFLRSRSVMVEAGSEAE